MSQAIIFYPDRAVPAMAASARLSFDKIELVAGINNLLPEQIEVLQQHPDFTRYVNLKAIELIESSDIIEPSINTEVLNLGLLNVEDAQKIVMETVDVTTLEHWQVTESRKTVKSTIATRLMQIKSGVF